MSKDPASPVKAKYDRFGDEEQPSEAETPSRKRPLANLDTDKAAPADNIARIEVDVSEFPIKDHFCRILISRLQPGHMAERPAVAPPLCGGGIRQRAPDATALEIQPKCVCHRKRSSAKLTSAGPSGVGCVRMVWYGMVWYGMVWYSMVWHGICQCETTGGAAAELSIGRIGRG